MLEEQVSEAIDRPRGIAGWTDDIRIVAGTNRDRHEEGRIAINLAH